MKSTMKKSEFGPWADEAPTVYQRPRGAAPKQRLRTKGNPQYLHVPAGSTRMNERNQHRGW